MSVQILKRVSVVGLGKLGAPMVACFAARGLEVVGVETDSAKIRELNNGIAPVSEPGLQEMPTEGHGRYRATSDCHEAVLDTDATFVIVPTPSEPGGGFSLRYVLPAMEAIGRALREKPVFHLVVLTSTVMPGATEGMVRETLEASSGKQCGVDFGLCYSPEFIAIGSVIHDFLHPDFVLVGESDPHSGDLLAGIDGRVCLNNPPVARMDFVNAELAKIAVNTFVTAKITFANMIAGICERLPGANVDTVTDALGLDSRIGKRYLKGALGYGGPCFPRDNVALGALARSLGVSSTLAEATDRANNELVGRVAAMVRRRVFPGSVVGILGLSYKPDTGVIDESQAIDIAQAILDSGVQVIVYDPLAMDNARSVLKGPIEYCASQEECARSCDVLVLATPWPLFLSLDPDTLRRDGNRVVLIDCWRLYDGFRFGAVADYIPLGVGLRAPETALVTQAPGHLLARAV